MNQQTYPDCPVRGCGNSRNAAHVMCGTCWGYVAPELQRKVYADWNRTKRGAISMKQYLDTRQEAIDQAEKNRFMIAH